MSKARILITDDEEDYGMMMKHYFHTRGYEVRLAFTLADGLSILHAWQPDILFLDNNLPDGEGWQSVETIVENFPQLKIYLVSAYKHASDITPSPQITVWEKPISFSVLNEIFNQ